MVKVPRDSRPAMCRRRTRSINRSISIVSFLIAVSVHSSGVHAEDGCPSGQVPQQGNGWRSCVPLNNGGTQPGPADNFVGPTWSPRWISLAIDNIKPILGKSGESRTLDQARRSAIDDCMSQGGTTCHTMVTAQNGCVALVSGMTQITTGGSPIQRLAEEKALEDCKKTGDTGCRVYYSACVKPVPE